MLLNLRCHCFVTPMDQTFALSALALGVLAWTLPRAKRRLELSRAKHRSLAGHSRMAKRIAALIPGYAYDEERFFASDDAPAEVVAPAPQGFAQLCSAVRAPLRPERRDDGAAREGISDLQFTGSYRVPFQYSPYLRQHLKSGSFLRASSGVTVTDLDGNVFYDLTGSYGVNVFGYDFYKQLHRRRRGQGGRPRAGAGRLSTLAWLDNVQRLKAISGLDEVSFHMSGTEAVMQAVRLARYHTRRSHLVRFCGAYHGWWEDVQPGTRQPAAAARDLHAEGDGREIAARAAQPQRHRLRAGQPAAGAAPEQRRAGRLVAGGQQPARRASTAPPTPTG